MAKKHSFIETEADEEETRKSDFQALLDLIKENPLLYAAGVAFIAVCALAGISYRFYSDGVGRERTAEYARALDIEDPVEQYEALAKVAVGNSALSAEALYLSGEMAFRGSDVEKAKEAFARLREEFPDFEFTPDAIEGLGYIEEDAGHYGESIAKYREILDKFPDSFAGRRQSFNIGRSKERSGEILEAIDAYREQLTAFPGSNVARRAQAALDRLRESNSGLFADVAGTNSEMLSTFESVLESLETISAEDSAEEAAVETEEEAPAEAKAEVTPEDLAEPEPVDTESEEAEATGDAEASGTEETASEEASPASEEDTPDKSPGPEEAEAEPSETP